MVLRAGIKLKGTVIHERLVDQYGFTGNYQRIKLWPNSPLARGDRQGMLSAPFTPSTDQVHTNARQRSGNQHSSDRPFGLRGSEPVDHRKEGGEQEDPSEEAFPRSSRHHSVPLVL